MSKIAVLFPGQGAQNVGMAKALCEAFPASRETFDEAEEVLGFDLAKLCFEGPQDDLTRTDNAQVAIYVTSMAALRGLEAAGRFNSSEVAGTAGLSLGEYTALCYAGALSFADGLRLVRLRGEAMQDASEARSSGMVSLIGSDEEKAQALCDAARDGDILVVANLNAPGQVVISGEKEACARAVELAREHGIRRAIPLEVAGAFHSPVMEPARARLQEALEGTPFTAPRIPVWANVTAEAVSDSETARSLLAQQVTSPVRWEASMRAMIAAGFRSFHEPEPGKVLAGIMKKIDRECPVVALDVTFEANA